MGNIDDWKALKPPSVPTSNEIKKMHAHLRKRAIGLNKVQEYAEQSKKINRDDRIKAEYISVYLELVRALRASGKITIEEYIVRMAHKMEYIHEERWMNGEYNDLLNPLTAKMREIERLHGLTQNQYWTKFEQPEDYAALAEDYDAILDKKLIEVMREFGEDDLAHLLETDSAKFYAQREVGRLAIFEKDDVSKALANLILVYEDQASKAASAHAYFAACVMLGSASETRLLFKCIQEPEKAEAARIKLPDKIKSNDPSRWSLENLISICEMAGWLGVLEDDDFTFYIDGLVDQLRRSRNFVHPARHTRERPYRIPGIEAYEDAIASYAALCMALAR